MDLRGQRVVVIGGTSGIGYAVARRAVEAGASVVVGSRRQAGVDSALDRLGAAADGRTVDVEEPAVSGRTVDVGDAASVAGFVESAGEFDHLVYTAGGPLSMMTVADLDLARARSFFEARYFGALGAVHAAAPRLREGGSITLTSGSAGERPGTGWSLGASVCGAMNSLTRALALELAPLRVNAVAPGILRSPVWSEMDQGAQERMYEAVAGQLPVGRVGEVEDAADAYLYCMTQRHTTGTVLGVDGGTLLV